MNQRIIKAASDIETLAAYMKDLVLELRAETDPAVAYAKVYWLRADMGKIVGSLGTGVPARSRTAVRPLNLLEQ